MPQASGVGDTEDSNLKLPVWLSMTRQWIASLFIPPASLQSIAEATGEGEVSWLFSPFPPLNQTYYAGKDNPFKRKECLMANSVPCTLLLGCLSDKLCFCSLRWVYVCVSIFGHCG